MNITILSNRDVLINSSDNLGTQNENNASIMNFNFPDNFTNANKKIVFITDDGNYWDLITNNSYKITNAVTKYKNVSAYVWLVDTENDIDFRSKIWNINFNMNKQPDDVVPTEEEISGFDTMIKQLNDGLEELDTEYNKVEAGLISLNQALTEVDNIDIDASKTGNVATITITNKEGTEKSVQISDGTDYVITQEDYQAIANVVEQDIADEIPTKTSDLENDSGFIDNTVNNLTNYTLKTNTGSLIDLEINSTTYVITLRLKDVDGNVISTDTVDLPLESVVVGGSYDSVNKKIVLTLENGNTVDILVGDLIAGLQTEITNNNKLASDLVDDTNSGNKFVTTSEKQTWNGKYNKPVGGIPKTDLSSAVQTSLGKADSALQEHQDISSKEDKTNKVTSIDENSTDTQYPSAKLLYDQLAEKQAEIDGLVAENTVFKKQIPTAHISTTSTQLTDSAEDLPIENVKIKGATSQQQYEGYQLLDISQISNQTISNIQVVVDAENGTIALNGTASESFVLNIPIQSISAETVVSYGANNPVSSEGIQLRFSQSASTSTIFGGKVLSETYSKKENLTLSNETDLFQVRIASGTTLSNFVLKPILNLGNTVKSYEPYTGGQASPNPSYTQDIHRVTGNCNEKVQNNNLVDEENISAYNNIDSIVGNLVTTTASSVATFNTSISYPVFNLEANTDYYLSCDIRIKSGTGNLNSLQISGSDFSVASTEWIKKPTLSNTFQQVVRKYNIGNGGIARRSIVQTINNDDVVLEFKNVQISKVNKDYISHSEQNAPLTLGNTELYEDDEIEIDYVQKAGYKKVTGARFVKNNAKIASYNGETITTEYKSTTGQLTTGATVVYKLATPVTTEITDSTLLAQLETLINMKTYKEITNIESTGADLAPVLDCDYYQDMSTIKTDIATINARLDLLES